MAATQIVVFVLRFLTRAELILHMYQPADLVPDRISLGFGAILFVAAQATVRRDDATGRAGLERLVRRRVERAYARQGLRDVAYDLQIL